MTKKRTLSDEEIGLIKAMIAKGMKNDQVHYYFNLPDRLISPGRISQIKSGKYGSAVAAASPSELGDFLDKWTARSPAPEVGGPAEPTDSEVILAMFQEVQGAWCLRLGETDQAESKRSFRLSPERRFADCIKTIAGLANNRGGYLLFGINDGTQSVEGLDGSSFHDTDPAEINRCLAGALDPVPHVVKATALVGGKRIGVIYVQRHAHGPVVAVKNIGDDLKEGAIYYRYVGETRLIRPGELRQIIANREQQAIAEFTQRMLKVASGAAATFDLETGQVSGRTGSFMIDKNLLPSLQFIREGDFSEVKGAPALRLIGDVEPVSPAEQERARIIRDNVTPDAVIRNFLKGDKVADPMQYIHAQAHCQRRWLPVWYYVRQTKQNEGEIIEDLRAQVASHPSSRDAVVKRLLRTESAFKVHPGKPAKLLERLGRGEVEAPSANNVATIANAIMGLPAGTRDPERLKPLLLSCLDIAERDTGSGTRSAVYRAACRIDELLHRS